VRGITAHIFAYDSVGKGSEHSPGYLSVVRVEWIHSSFVVLKKQCLLPRIFWVEKVCMDLV